MRDAEPPPEPPRRPATNADLATPLGRGKYLVHLAGCVHCHTARPLVGTEWERRKDLEFECLNSWGSSWGKDGHFFLSAVDMQRLVFSENGEAWCAVELS